MHSAIHHFNAAQREADLVRQARRNPVPARAPRPLDEPAPSRFAALTRRLARPHAQGTVLHHRS